MNENGNRPSPESLLATLNDGELAKLRVYIGAAPGVGKTYQMLADAHLLKKQGADIVIAAVEPHGREDTKEMIGDLERVDGRDEQVVVGQRAEDRGQCSEPGAPDDGNRHHRQYVQHPKRQKPRLEQHEQTAHRSNTQHAHEQPAQPADGA